jgi:hypothetical protein
VPGVCGDRRGDRSGVHGGHLGVRLGRGRPASHGQGGYGARYATLPILLLDAALIVVAASQGHRRGRRAESVLAAGFRYPACRLAGRAADWELTADKWLHRCQYQPAATITATFHIWWGPVRIATSSTSLRR